MATSEGRGQGEGGGLGPRGSRPCRALSATGCALGFMHEIEAGPRADCCLLCLSRAPTGYRTQSKSGRGGSRGLGKGPRVVAGTGVASAGPEDSGRILHRL